MSHLNPSYFRTKDAIKNLRHGFGATDVVNKILLCLLLSGTL